MIPYIILILALIVLGSLSVYFSSNKKLSIIFLISSALILFLFGTFKSSSVGRDTVDYIDAFNSAKSLNLIDFINSRREGKEPLFYAFMWTASKINLPYLLFNSLILFLSYSATCLFLWKRSKYPTFFFVLFSFFMLINMSLSAIRQTMALTYVVLALLFFTSKRLKWYIKFPLILVLFVLAYLNHVSSIFALIIVPLYYLFKKENYAKMLIILLPTCTILFSFIYTLIYNTSFSQIIDYTYLPYGEKFSYVGIAIFVVYALILFWPKNKIFNYKYNQSNAAFVVVFLCLISTNYFSAIISRLQFYLAPCALLFFEDIEFKNKKVDYGVKGVLLIAFALYFVASALIKNPLIIYPYKFFWQ